MMRHALEKKRPAAWAALWGAALLAALLLPACRDSSRSSGQNWLHPSNESMPRAFAEEADVPLYAKAWRMPEGFQGFPERWNAQVQTYLERKLAQLQKQAGDDYVQMMLQPPGHAKRRAAELRMMGSLQSLGSFARRSSEGDYLQFLREKDIPKDLDWQDGMDEPELGSPEARKGGSLRLALQRSFPATLRPFGPNSNNATRRYLYDDIDMLLTRLHPQTGKIIPGTADRWAVSADGRTVFFHLDEKARFSDGSPLSTRDFVTSLFVRSSPYSQEPFYGDYYMGNFSHIRLYGNHVLAVTLPLPRLYAPFYASIPVSCTPFYAEFGPDYPTRYLWRVPPTTGAYTLAKDGAVMGRSLTLERVRNWWAADRKFTRYSCNVDSIVYSFVSETSKVRELFRIGELDVFSARDADFWYEGLEIEPVHRGYIQRVRFFNIWPRNCFGFHLNCASPFFSDINMRRGFHHALNVQAVIDSIFRGDYSRMGSYFSGFGRYTDEGIRARDFSPEKARAYFAKAGYTKEGGDGILRREDGARLQIVVSSRIDPLYANCMNMLREDAARCGVDLRMEQMDDTVFYLKVKDKQYDAAIFSWGFSPPLPDPSAFYLSQYAYNPDGSPMKGSSNITATSSPELDQAIYATRRAATEEQAEAAHHRVQRLIADTCSWVPGWTTDYWRFAQWRWLRWPDTPDCRFCPPRYYDPLDSHLYWIDEEMKKETLRARSQGESFPDAERDIPLPPAP